MKRILTAVYPLEIVRGPTKEILSIDTGAIGSVFDPTGMTPPLAADFTSTFGSNITVTDKVNRMLINLTASSAGLRGVKKASIATPYTIDLAVVAAARSTVGNTFFAGIALSDGTKYLTFSMGVSGSVAGPRVFSWTNATTFSAVVFQETYNTMVNTKFFLRLTDDGANRGFYFSNDGKDFTLLFTEATNTFLTPTEHGIVVQNDGTNYTKVGIYDWKVTPSILGDAA